MTDRTAPASPHRVAEWRKSSYSKGDSDCVEVSTGLPGRVGIRDSKLGPTSPILTVPAAQWRALLTALRTGDLS